MNNRCTIQFLGGAGTVTGSKYLVESHGRRVMLDCGLFQGLKELRLRNRRTPPHGLGRIDAVVVSHAHIDHSGQLPLLVRYGYRGPIFCTPGTKSLLEIMLPDAAHIQEEEAAYANRHGYSKHRPAEPLFTLADAERALRQLRPIGYGRTTEIAGGFRTTLRRAGHILGSATVQLDMDGERPLTLVFSGDLGRGHRPMLRGPDPVEHADILLVESTYGDRLHLHTDIGEELATVVNDAVRRGGALIVPAFAVGRTQELIWHLRLLEDAGRIPRVPVYIDSPMALDAGEIFCRHPEDHELDMKLLMDKRRCPLCCKPYQLIRSPAASKAINERQGPMIIIAASGMATAGRVVHHLEHRVSDPRTTVLLVGFQAAGTRGRALQDGAEYLKIHGRKIPVRAAVTSIHGLSAHADRSEILSWLRHFRTPPRQTFIVHGEPACSAALSDAIATELGWRTTVPGDLETVVLRN